MHPLGKESIVSMEVNGAIQIAVELNKPAFLARRHTQGIKDLALGGVIWLNEGVGDRRQPQVADWIAQHRATGATANSTHGSGTPVIAAP